MSLKETDVPKMIGQINNVKHYANGAYEFIFKEPQKDGMLGRTGNIYLYKHLISSRFNQLKAKLFNLAETSSSDETQRKAMKGLIKDFCNEQYRCTIGDMNYFVRDLGFEIEEWMTETPLEDGDLKPTE
ncbi:MAG: hypothetical protein WC438_06400 [Candidatus Pacearchaeota archaeon]